MIPFSWFSSLTDVRAQSRVWNEFADLSAMVATPLVTERKDKAPLYSPAIYNGTPRRAAVNVVGMSCIVLDFDNAEGTGSSAHCIHDPDLPEDIIEQLPGVALVWHTTHSNKTDWPKWRLILPVDTPIHPRDYQTAMTAAIQLCGNPPGVDLACKDVARAFFVPSCPDSTLYRSGSQEGEPLTLEYLADLAGVPLITPSDYGRQTPAKPKTPATPTQSITPGRNNALKAICAAMLDRQESMDKIISELVTYDRTKHTPPLFGDPAESQYANMPAEVAATKFLSSMMVSINQTRTAQGLAPQVPQPPPPKTDLYLSVSDLLNNPVTVSWLIKGRIEANTTGYTFGPPGGGKTFEAIHRWLCVASGLPCNGAATTQGLVLYCCGEGHGGITRRVKAWMLHHNLTPDHLALFHVSRGTVSLEGLGVATIIAEAEALQQRYQMPLMGIVVDTVARHLHGDENSTRDMNQFISALDTLRQAFPGAVAEGIHHCGHQGGRGRGSSALKGAVDWEYEIDAGLITCHKMKDADRPLPQEFKLLSVPIGEDEDGETITSCVVEYGATSDRQANTLSPLTRVAVKLLIELSAQQQRPDPDGRFGAHIGDWRDAIAKDRRAYEPDVSNSALSTQFNRSLKQLKEQGLLKYDERYAVLISDGYQSDIGTLIFANKLTGKM